jgi:hypothetical protein
MKLGIGDESRGWKEKLKPFFFKHIRFWRFPIEGLLGLYTFEHFFGLFLLWSYFRVCSVGYVRWFLGFFFSMELYEGIFHFSLLSHFHLWKLHFFIIFHSSKAPLMFFKKKEVIYTTTSSLMGAPLIFKRFFMFFWMLLEFSIFSYCFEGFFKILL